MDPRITEIERTQVRSDLPAFAPGDTVRVRVRVSEGAKTRIQAFEGICIARKGGKLSETFTVRKISGGVGVERIFPMHSPSIAGIEVVRRGHVRRAKLYYLRARRGKSARVRERRWWEGGGLSPKGPRSLRLPTRPQRSRRRSPHRLPARPATKPRRQPSKRGPMARTAPTDYEREAWERGLARVVGVDEAGCGPLAGPVVAAAVALKPGQNLEGVYDSKALSRKQREELAREIRDQVLAFSIAAASTREIERLNIRRATSLAMRRAVRRLPFEPELLLVDGRSVPGLGEHTAIVKGDRLSLSIACASILSKTVRDRLMDRLSSRYPAYGWDENKGYGTGQHLAAIREHGPTPHHRCTWAPIAQTELLLEA